MDAQDKEVNLNLTEVIKAVAKALDINELSLFPKNAKDHFFKKQRIKPYKRDKVFSTDTFSVLELVYHEKEKIGELTYQHCRDKEYNNYFLLAINLKKVNIEGDDMPLKILIKHPYSEKNIEAQVTDKNYNQSEDLTSKLYQCLFDNNIFI